MYTDAEVAFAMLAAHDESGFITKDHSFAEAVLNELRENGHSRAEIHILYGGYVVMCPGMGSTFSKDREVVN